MVANAESPMEVKVAMLMCLPRRHGGGALPLPELGFSVSIPDCYRKTSSINTFRYDFYWPGSNLEVEYDSDAVHAASEKLFRDARRRNIIQALGVTSLSLTRGQVMHETAFEEFIRELYSMQCIRYRTPRRSIRLPSGSSVRGCSMSAGERRFSASCTVERAGQGGCR